jgi:hypothetical protein
VGAHGWSEHKNTCFFEPEERMYQLGTYDINNNNSNNNNDDNNNDNNNNNNTNSNNNNPNPNMGHNTSCCCEESGAIV